MANKRIKDLSTTAAVTASDDFIAVDGATNGTRKLDAYSPTFGGNLTVSGTGTSSVAGKLGIGTTAPTTSLHIAGSTGSSTDFALSGSNVAYAVFDKETVATAGNAYGIRIGKYGYSSLAIGWNKNTISGDIPANAAYIGINGADKDISFAHQLDTTPVTRVLIKSTGNLLLGTTTDTGEKLQVNGTGYFAGALLQLGNGSNDALYRVSASNGKSSDFGDDTTGGFVRANNSQSLRFITGGNIVLTLDSSANATFAGTIKPQQAATASAPTYVKGAIYFDTTLNKLRVGGATGWETITSA